MKVRYIAYFAAAAAVAVFFTNRKVPASQPARQPVHAASQQSQPQPTGGIALTGKVKSVSTPQ